MFSYTKNMSFIFIIAMSFAVMSCSDTTMTDMPTENETESLGVDIQPNQLADLSIIDGDVAGRTIGGIELPLEGGQMFTGRITNLKLTEGNEAGTVLASGRLIGNVNGERINERFENISLQVFDELGEIVDGENGTCQILFLELGPIFLDLLGLVVEIPDPIVVEIRAERGPGNLLGNLLCELVGILD